MNSLPWFFRSEEQTSFTHRVVKVLAIAIICTLFLGQIISIAVASSLSHVEYNVHLAFTGWESTWSEDYEVAGDAGEEIQAIKINASDYSLEYQAHVANKGWMSWKQDGEVAGTTGEDLPMEAIKVQLVDAPSYVHVRYEVYIEDEGWQSQRQDGEVAGTTGEMKRLEAIRIKIVEEYTVDPQITIDGSTSSSGPQGTTFTVEGSGFTPGSTAQQHIITPSGDDRGSTIEVDGNGDLDWPYTSSCSDEVGTYEIWVTDTSGAESDPVTQEITASSSCEPEITDYSFYVNGQSVDPPSVPVEYDDTLTFVYQIDNPTNNSVDVKLGASIRKDSPEGNWKDDISHDRVVSVSSGKNDYSRTFDIPDGVDTGNYDLRWVLVDQSTGDWVDENIMDKAIEIGATVDPQITIDGSTHSSGSQGTTFTVEGSGFTPGSTAQQHIITPSGDDRGSTIEVDGNGDLDWPYTSSCSDPVGTYEIWVTDTSGADSNHVTQEITASSSCEPQITDRAFQINDNSVHSFPAPVQAGDTIKFGYHISNPTDNPIDIKLGARVRKSSPQGDWKNDFDNDEVESIPPGGKECDRLFEITQKLDTGVYDIQWVIVEQKTGNWLDKETRDEAIKVGVAPNHPPDAPTELKQLRSDGVSPIGVGNKLFKKEIVFQARIEDPEKDKVKLQIELRGMEEYEGGFNENAGGFKESELTESGNKATASAKELVSGDYHWRARTIDENGNKSEWVEFGNNKTSQIDFVRMTVKELRGEITRWSKLAPIYPPYIGVAGLLSNKYDRLYYTGFDYGKSGTIALRKALKFLDSDKPKAAFNNLESAKKFQRLRNKSFAAAAKVAQNDLEQAEEIAQWVSKSCRAVSTLGLGFVGSPVLAKGVDYLYLAVHEGAEYVLLNKTPSYKKVVMKVIITETIDRVKWDLLDGRTLSSAIKNRTGKHLFPLIRKVVESDEWKQWALTKLSKKVSVKITEGLIEELAYNIANQIENFENSKKANLNSPGELRVYNSKEQVTGLKNGKVKQEIPRSVYTEEEVIITNPGKEKYEFEIVGTESGSYDLEIASIKSGERNNFSALHIPTRRSKANQYTADWQKLSQGEDGVTVKTDEDGDGTYEDEMNVGNAFSGMEAGTNVKKEFTNQGISLVFDEVTSRGFTDVNVLKKPGFNTSSGIHLVGDTYKFDTTASFSGDVEVTLNYNDSHLTNSQEESLKLFKVTESGEVADITTSKDQSKNTVTGATQNFSSFAVGYPEVMSMASDWNLFSPPGIPLDPNPSSVLGDDIDPLNLFYDYSPGEGYTTYPDDAPNTQLSWKEGYWVHVKGETPIAMDTTDPPGELTIDLSNEGWHMIGLPYNVDWNQVKVEGPDGEVMTVPEQADGPSAPHWMSKFIWEYDPGEEAYKAYEADLQQTVLSPQKGFWVRAYEEDLTLIIPSVYSSSYSTTDQAKGIPASDLGQDIETPPAPPPVPSADGGGLLTVKASLNPAQDHVIFEALQAVINKIKVSLFDASGVSIYESPLQDGSKLTWNLTDSEGDRVPNGIYLYQLEAKGESGQTLTSPFKKLLILR